MPWQTLNPGTLWKLTNDNVASIQSSGKMPTVFMTGDGHRNPPFQWITRCESLKQHFQDLLDRDKLCVHVEEYEDQVNCNSVPPLLKPLHTRKRIFGWELEIYRSVELYWDEFATHTLILLQLDPSHPSKKLITSLEKLHMYVCRVQKRLHQIGFPAELAMSEAHQEYLDYYKDRYEASLPKRFYQTLPRARPRMPKKEYSKFAKEYHETALKLRTSKGVHTAIGGKIRPALHRHSAGWTHLITCGKEHIDGCSNSLDRFLTLPGGENGVVDAESAKLLSYAS